MYAPWPPALGTYRRRRAACPQGPVYCTYWVRVPATGVPYVPRTVAPQVGYVLLMRPHGFTALILPDFTSHDHGGVNEPFARLFDPAPMIASLAAVGIVARAQPLPGERLLL